MALFKEKHLDGANLISRIIIILYLISAINYAVHRRKFLLSSVRTK